MGSPAPEADRNGAAGQRRSQSVIPFPASAAPGSMRLGAQVAWQAGTPTGAPSGAAPAPGASASGIAIGPSAAAAAAAGRALHLNLIWSPRREGRCGIGPARWLTGATGLDAVHTLAVVSGP